MSMRIGVTIVTNTTAPIKSNKAVIYVNTKKE